jgi:hypothetical protein
MDIEARELERYRGSPVRSEEGMTIGLVDLIMLDRATREPEWIGVPAKGGEGAWRPIPVAGARLAEGEILVPYPKERVDEAPRVTAPDISEAEERSLYRHYGIKRSKEESLSGLPEPSQRPTARRNLSEQLYRVTPKEKGGWSIVKEGSSKPAASARLKKDAVRKARMMAKSAGADLVIHKVDGEVQQELSYRE